MAHARITDVARQAGVSSRTVTRVLQGGHKVAPDTKRRVDKALKDLNYSPDLIAQALKTSKTMIIGVIVQDLAAEVLVKKLLAVERKASGNGYRTILGITERDFARERKYINDYSRMCDGIFLFVDWPDGASSENLRILRANGTPNVVIDGPPDAQNCVCIDRGVGIREALQESHGSYSNYIYLTDTAPTPRDQRCKAFMSFLESVGKGGQGERLVGEGPPFELGYQSAEHVAEIGHVLVCCQSDRMAMGLLKRLTELGVDVPRDVGIVGFDNDSYSRFTSTALSTILQPVDEVGEEAFDLLMRQIQGDDPGESRVVRTAFVKRDTTLPGRNRS